MPDPDEPAFAVVNCVASADEDQLREVLQRQGFSLLTLSGAGVRDKPGFLKQAAADLPPVEDLEPHNWDAFADYLWNVIAAATSDQVALLWTDADSLERSDLQVFLDAVRGITDVARGVMSGEGGFPREVVFLAFLLGSSPEYPRLIAG